MKRINSSYKLIEFLLGRGSGAVNEATVELRFRVININVQAGHHHTQQIDRQSALQMSQKENNNRIPFTLTFHPHNHAVKSIILKNFKLFQNDHDTGRILSQPPLISFKRDKNITF